MRRAAVSNFHFFCVSTKLYGLNMTKRLSVSIVRVPFLEMASKIVCGGETFEVAWKLLSKLNSYVEHPEWLAQTREVASTSDPRLFRQFLAALDDENIVIDRENFSVLKALCDEFGFAGLRETLDERAREHPEVAAEMRINEELERWRPPTVDDKDYTVLQKIGYGSLGDVFKVIHRETGEVCVKEGLRCIGTRELDHFLHQVRVLSDLHIPEIVRILGVRISPTLGFETWPSDPGAIFTEYAPNGTLKQKLYEIYKGKRDPHFGSTEMSKAIFGIAATMAKIHKRKIMHGELRPSKVLIDENFEIKLQKFGLLEFSLFDLGRKPFSESALFAAPEVNEFKMSFPSDVYAFAIFVYRVFTNNLVLESGPCRRIHQCLMRLLRGDRPKRVPEMSDIWWELITKCWKQDPNDRPTFDDIVGKMLANDELVIRGTDLSEYKKYQRRLVDGIQSP